MYVWCGYKWMCQWMMNDQGNVLNPWSLIQPYTIGPIPPIHLSLPWLLHLSGKSHGYSISLLQTMMWSSLQQSKYLPATSENTHIFNVGVHVVSPICVGLIWDGSCLETVLCSGNPYREPKTGPPSSLIIVSGQGWPNLHDQGSDKCHYWTGASHLPDFISR